MKCSKPFIYPSFLQMHERAHPQEKIVQCKQCDKALSHHRFLQRHERNIGEKIVNV
jgi:uncharacterized Zn-finger protein